MASSNDRVFAVVVHDVCEEHLAEVEEIVDSLEAYLGRDVSAAVVPLWHGKRPDQAGNLRAFVSSRFGEVLLHGWTHQRDAGRGIVSALTNRSDEFAGLTRQETEKRLQRAQVDFTSLFGTAAVGFVAPAWRRGCIDPKVLARHGLKFLVGYFAIHTAECRRVSLSTVTWDLGRFGTLGLASDAFGRALLGSRPNSMACVAVHPVDVTRGYLPRVIALVDALVQSGRRPTTIASAVEALCP